MTDFVHLHCHSEYSLLDGLCRLKPLAKKVKALGMPAVALTDHGVMFGAMEFYRAAREEGIKPIIGCELYVARRDMRDKDPEADKRSHHLVVLAENLTGYKNLLQIASAAQLEGFYYKPRVDHAFLETHAEGLICLSACKSGELIRAIEAGHEEESRRLAAWHKEVFGPGNYFMELQYREGLPEMEGVNKELSEIAHELDIPLVATNDVHYIAPEDAVTHELLLAIQTSTTLSDPKRMRMGGNDYYVRTPDEMARLFSGQPDAVRNTVLIAERCNLNLDNKGYHLPVFDVPAGHTDQSFLRELAEAGFARRYPGATPELRERLDYELGVIHKMGFNTYFLIVWDLVRYALESGIWYNIRGSAAGSMVSYTLGITMLDPVKNKLIFERFLNPGRVTMPDIDMDFPDDRRGEMIEYAVRKYGKDRVAQIITFGTLGAKAAIRDVARATGVELSEADRLARLVPGGPKVHLADQLKEGELAALYKTDPDVRELIDRALSLEGISRHASTHAAGVVITDKPLTEYVPLHRATKQSNDAGALGVITQYPMEDLEDAGLLKMDFLGLATLTIMRRAVDLIAATRGETVDIDQVPLDDPAIYELLSSGNVEGVFQVESAGMRKVLTGLRPTQFEDVGAVIALYRPGPMQFIDNYIARKHGTEPIQYRHAKLKPILEDTYGVCISGDSTVFDAVTGKRFRMDELGNAGDIAIQGVDEHLHNAIGRVTHWVHNGRKPVFEMRLRNGSQIKATADHRFMTELGWRTISELRAGDYVATPSELFAQDKTFDLRKLRVLAYLLAEGDLGNKLSVNFVSKDPALIEEYERCIKAFDNVASTRVPQIRGVTRISTAKADRQHYHAPSDLLAWLREYRLKHAPGSKPGGVRSAEKFVPDFVFALNQDQIAYFLASLWDGDGYTSGKFWHYKTISARLAWDVQTLLLKLGIPATTYSANYDSVRGPRTSYQVTVFDTCSMVRWLAPHMVTDKRLGVASGQSDPTILRSIFVTEAESATTLSKRALKDEYGIDRRHFSPAWKHRSRISAKVAGLLTARLDLPQTQKNLRVRWTEVLSITPAGEDDVYDITVQGLHNFVANNIIVHNCIYQEQIIQIMTDLAGYSPGDADLVRRAVGKKKEDELKKHRAGFVAGAQKLSGIAPQIAEDIWADIEYFANYGFNKAHSADYALVTCQTAWLKAHYPVEYMTALLSVARGDTDKIASYTAECARLKLEVLPPRLNASDQDFAVEQQISSLPHSHADDLRPSAGKQQISSLPHSHADDLKPSAGKQQAGGMFAIRFGLGAIKNVGDGVVSLLVAERKANGPYKSLEDFCERVDLRQVNKRALECLVKCGVFDDFGRREQLLAVMDRMLESSQRAHHAQSVGQLDLFGGLMGTPGLSFSPLPAAEERPLKEVLAWEKELTGIYLSEHPLKRIMPYVERNATATIGQIDANLNGQMIILAAMVVSARTIQTKKGDTMVFAQLEDLHGTIEVTVFPRLYARTTELWQPDTAVVLRAKVEERDGKMKLLAESAEPLPRETTPETVLSVDEMTSVLAATPILVNSGNGHVKQKKIVHYHMFITVPRSGDHTLDITRVGEVYELLQAHPGEDRFSIYTTNSAGRILLDFPNATTKHSVQLQQKLTQILGVGTVKIKSIEEAA